jgi:TPR repeat protein
VWKLLAFLAALAAAWVGVMLWPPGSAFVRGRLDNNLGFLYSKGIVVKQDAAEANRWWRLAAQHGNAAGQINLAFALQNGVGVAVDEAAAAQWYECAARQGVAEAANNLGTLYANPATRKPDLVQAHVWFKRAQRLGDRDLSAMIVDNVATLERDMSGAQLARSQEILAAPYP